MDISPASTRQRWTPTYLTQGRSPYFVDFEPLHECPVSFITSDPQVLEIVMTMNRARLAFQATGASLYGPNLSQWPPWAYEALIAIEQERAATDAAQSDAERRDAQAASRRRTK